MTLFVIATKDGDSYPTVHRIFFSEEKALAYAKNDFKWGKQNGSEEPQRITHQYDLNDPMYMHDPLQLGKAEEGEEIVYYRGLTNEWYMTCCELDEMEKSSVRPL